MSAAAMQPCFSCVTWTASTTLSSLQIRGAAVAAAVPSGCAWTRTLRGTSSIESSAVAFSHPDFPHSDFVDPRAAMWTTFWRHCGGGSCSSGCAWSRVPHGTACCSGTAPTGRASPPPSRPRCAPSWQPVLERCRRYNRILGCFSSSDEISAPPRAALRTQAAASPGALA